MHSQSPMVLTRIEDEVLVSVQGLGNPHFEITLLDSYVNESFGTTEYMPLDHAMPFLSCPYEDNDNEIMKFSSGRGCACNTNGNQ